MFWTIQQPSIVATTDAPQNSLMDSTVSPKGENINS
jgi:hypothetical protein